MLRIAVCDTDKSFQRRLLDFISRDGDIDDDYLTECFNNVLEVKSRIDQKDFNFDLLFLMIDGIGKDSIALLEYIREMKFDVDVFLLAETVDFITDAFRVNAFSYIVKPLDYKKFEYEMKQYLTEKKNYQKEYLSVQIQGKEHLIPLSTVLYFTSDVRKIGAHFLNDDREIWFYGKLDNLQLRLEEYGYIRCHQSYLVNGRQIEDINSESIITSGGKLPISRKYSTTVKRKWEDLKKLLYNDAKITNLVSSKDNNSSDENEVIIGTSKTAIITKEYGLGTSKYGMIVGIKGEFHNTSYRIYGEDEAIIGRDSKLSHIVVNNQIVSRKHCGISFDVLEQCYKICDYSTNGTIVSGVGKLPKNTWIKIKKNSFVQLVNENCSFLLV